MLAHIVSFLELLPTMTHAMLRFGENGRESLDLPPLCTVQKHPLASLVVT